MEKNIKIKLSQDTEFTEALSKLRLDIKSTRTMLLVFWVLAGVVKVFFRNNFPIFSLSFLILVWFSLYFVYEYFVGKTKTAKELYRVYFLYNIIDLLFLTAMIHYLGGAEWIGGMFYILTLLLAGIILPARKTILLGFIASFFYTSLVLLEYFGIISHRPLFLLNPGLYQTFSYVGTQILVIAALFYFVVDISAIFSEMLKEKRRELAEEREKTYQEAQRAREVLEIRVNARTKELKELTETLEEKVKARTKELQEKIKELEKLQKLFVGRELKMVELKKRLKD